MDEPLIAQGSSFQEQCSQCSAVDWGVTEEGGYFCRSCHNVIERTLEVLDSYHSNYRVSRISRESKKNKKLEHGNDWMVCEGFQFILKHQAEALLEMGVCPQFKDDVLCNFWRRYLQKSNQAYTRNPVTVERFQLGSDTDGASESLSLSDFCPSASETDVESSAPSSISGFSSDGGASSVCSGSLDANSYHSTAERKRWNLMTMPMTLAFCHLSLLWLREALTLSDLLRFVAEGHIPYINAYQVFPEEMKLYGKDSQIFRVESIPSHRKVQQEAHKLAVFLDLPRFPPVTQEYMLHPALLSLKYLTEANLPDELHLWVCRVMEQAGVGEGTYLTYDPLGRKSCLLSYDILAAALIIVTMKLLFKMDDQKEWKLSKKTDTENKQNKDNGIFCLRKWYKTVQRALDLAKEKEVEEIARQSWKPRKPLYSSRKQKCVILKRRRVVEHLQTSFQKLTNSTPEPQQSPPCSFRFRWGEVDGDGPSYYNQHLGSVVMEKNGSLHLMNPKYWHTALKPCQPKQCRDHFREIEPTLPRSYIFLLQLFSFLLGVGESCIHAQVIQVERLLIRNAPRTPSAQKLQQKQKN
ncbi:TATA box-binding protein-associated factor RNA polymerase I subunit B [Scleropages formosus]|uniref:TATA box-binding protein-associated factor RNA polymerase I subunit B n=1 Tax=Scleropages formosus TaxID=113540 RepID=A0A8C9QZ74_SCLFO|nr:TATA box-binding protein-associated factor RNA polymerase I subunit B [Scleropages formosus]